MEDKLDNIILDSLTQQRAAISRLRKETAISKTDIEVLAYSERVGLYNLPQLHQFYSHTNIQQLRRSVKRLETNGQIQLVNPGVKNKPAYYLISPQGTILIRRYILMIRAIV